MMPKIKKVEFGEVHINDEVFSDHDAIVYWNSLERTEKLHLISRKEIHEMLLREPDVIIVSKGFSNDVRIDENAEKEAERAGIQLIALKTPDAVAKFKELSRAGKKVALRIHPTC
jgi:hypothetical protein